MAQVVIEYRNRWFDPASAKLTRFGANVSRTWLLNDIGTASIEFSASTPDLHNIIAPGNILTIHETGVPSWTGQVRRRSWSNGNVSVDLRAAECLLQKKLARQNLRMEGTAAQVAYELVLSGVIRDRRAPIQFGALDAHGSYHWVNWDYMDVWEGLQTLAETGGFDYWLDDGLRLHVRPRRGVDRSAVLSLAEGVDLSQVSLAEEYDDVLTAVVALGDGSDVSSKPIKLLELPNAAFWSAEVMEFRGVALHGGEADKLIGPATDVLQTRAGPRTTIDAHVTNQNGAWSRFGLGDTLSLVVNATVYQARVVGMELAASDEMRCIFEVVQPRVGHLPQPWTIG